MSLKELERRNMKWMFLKNKVEGGKNAENKETNSKNPANTTNSQINL